MKHRAGKCFYACAVAMMLLDGARAGYAQVTRAEGYTPPDDTPKVNVGITLFADYTYVDTPRRKDDEGRDINFSAFQIGRAYINVTGNLSHIFAFRITPDITRSNSTSGSTSGLPTGSYNFRLKLAYGQVNLDDWTTKGTYVRFGMHDTPWVPFAEGIYRYRFQGTIFSDREGFLSSADTGLTGRFNFPGNYGDLHLGVYNGEGFGNSEVNGQKAFQARLSVRPAPMFAVFKGLRLHGFYDGDRYEKDAKRERVIGSVTFEHATISLGAEYLTAKDQTRITAPELSRDGFSVWATPRTPMGIEALLRYDVLNTNKDARPKPKKKRYIAGLAYWPPLQGGKSVAFLLDYDEVKFENTTPLPPRDRRYALHTLFNF